jgi:hypothetical protein
MTSFTGVIRLADDPGSTIAADIDVFEDKLVLTASGAEIGSWPRSIVSLEPTPDGFAFEADGEHIIVEPSDMEGFAGAMGLDPAIVPSRGMRSSAPSDAHVTRLEPGTLTGAAPGGDVDPAWVHEQARTFGSLRERSAAEWHESDTIDKPVLYAIGVAIVLTVLGAALSWGNGSLFVEDFPVERVLFALIAITLVGALYLAVSQKQERQVVGLTTIGAGVFALLALWLWGRSTGVAVGYLVGAVAATVAIVAGGLAAADWGWVDFPHETEPDDVQTPAATKRSFVSRLLRRR